MFKFFTKKRNDFNYAIEVNGNMDLVRRRYEYQMSLAIDHYRNRDISVKNNHILTRLIQFGLINPEIDEFEYLNNIMANVDYVAKHFNITFNSCIGKLYKSVFYGENSYEAFILIKNKGNYFNLKDSYMEYNSIRCVYNEDSDIDFYYPKGTKDFTIPKMFIYEIDIVGLLMQYKYWYMFRLQNGKSTNPNIFIGQIVLPNMMPSILDWNVFNRFMNYSKSIPEDHIKNRNPFSIIDMSTTLNLVIKDALHKVTNKHITLDNLMKNIPLVFEDHSKELLLYELVYTNVQSEWLLILGRVKIILDFLNILETLGLESNKDAVSELRVMFRYLKSRHIKLENINIPIIKEDIDYTLNEIKKIIGYVD